MLYNSSFLVNYLASHVTEDSFLQIRGKKKNKIKLVGNSWKTKFKRGIGISRLNPKSSLHSNIRLLQYSCFICLKDTGQDVVIVRHVRGIHFGWQLKGTPPEVHTQTKKGMSERKKHKCLLQLTSEYCYMLQITPYKLGNFILGECHNFSSSCFWPLKPNFVKHKKDNLKR